MDKSAGRETEEIIIPVLAEQLEVNTVAVPRGGVRVIKRTVSEQQPIMATLQQSNADVRRVPVGQEVDGPLPIRQTEHGVVIPIVEEELVIQRRWILREEVHVERKQTTTEYRDSVTVSHDEVTIEQIES